MKQTGLFSDAYLEKRGVSADVLQQVTLLAIQIAREGREGRKIGTVFVIGGSDEVLQHSRSLILDPLAGHPANRRRISDPNLRETLKELAQLDGAFIVSDDGIILSACRYLDASSQGIDLPLGLGSRHLAAASITKTTKAVAVVVSESSLVRVFDDGDLVSEIIPELWMLKLHSVQVPGLSEKHTENEVTVISKVD